jgi:hypothetical protein
MSWLFHFPSSRRPGGFLEPHAMCGLLANAHRSCCCDCRARLCRQQTPCARNQLSAADKVGKTVGLCTGRTPILDGRIISSKALNPQTVRESPAKRKSASCCVGWVGSKLLTHVASYCSTPSSLQEASVELHEAEFTRVPSWQPPTTATVVFVPVPADSAPFVPPVQQAAFLVL